MTASRYPFGWTRADQAELDVLLWALVDGHAAHRQRCGICLEALVPCPHLQAAIRELCDWLHARQLLSKAQALRAEIGRAA